MKTDSETSTTLRSTCKIFTLLALATVLVSTGTAFSITVHSPDNTTYDTSSVELNTTADTEVDTWLFELDGNGTNITYTSPRTISELDEGEHNIRVWANETTDGNRSSAVRHFTVDTVKPNIQPQSPKKNNSNISDSVAVAATWSDATSTVTADYEVTNSSGVVATGDLNGSLDTTALEDGMYNITYNATDAAGNSKTGLMQVRVDNTDPKATNDVALFEGNVSVLESSNVASRILNDTTVGVNWSGYDPATELTDDIGIDHLELHARNKSFVPSTASFTDWSAWRMVGGSLTADANNTTASFDSGYLYEIKLVVVDTAGNTAGSNRINVTLDTDAPQRSSVTPMEWTNEAVPTVSGEVADIVGMDNTSVTMRIENLSDSWSDELRVDLSPDNASQYSVTGENVTVLVHNATYNVSITVEDRFGYGTTTFWNFTTDFVDPASVAIETVSDTVYEEWYRDEAVVDLSCTDAVSGAAEVAAFVAGSVHAGWNTTVPANLTLAEHGMNMYTFKCRDAAGNVNASINQTFSIDTETPTIEGMTVGEDVQGMRTNFTFTADFDSEANESGIDAGSSSLALDKFVGQEGAVSGVEWEVASVSAEVASLFNDEPYRLVGEIVDNVGHNVSFSREFRTKEGESDGSGGGGSAQTAGEDSVSISLGTVPDTVTLVAGTSKTVSIWVNNDMETNLSDVTVSLDVPETVSTSVEDGFTVGPGNSNKVDITFTAPESASTTEYTGSITVEGAEASVSEQFTFAVEGLRPVYGLEAPETVTVVQGETVKETVKVKNTGTVAGDTTVSTAFSDEFSTVIIPETVTVNNGSAEQVDLTVTAADSADIGVYKGSVSVEDVSSSVQIKVQPASEKDQNDISQRIQTLQERFESSEDEMNASNASAVEEMLADAQTAVEEGDYAQAAELEQEISRHMSASRQGFPIVPTLIVLLSIVFAALMGYILVSESIVVAHILEERLPTGEDKVYTFHEPPFVEQLAADVVATVSQIETAAQSRFQKRLDRLSEKGYYYQLYERFTGSYSQEETETWSVPSPEEKQAESSHS